MKYHYIGLSVIIVFLSFVEIFAKKKEDISKQKEIKSNNNYSNVLISSEKIIHNPSMNTTIAIGNVKIEYDRYHISADKVTFNHNTKRIIASGNIKLIDSNKYQIYVKNLDITDDFKNGIIKEITIDTPDKTYISAKSAKLIDGIITIFNQGTYTACSSCDTKTSFHPFWIIKSKKTILNKKEHNIRMEKAYLEFLSIPVAYLPFIEIPDETVKRKTGFLIPRLSYSPSDKIFIVSIPYHIVISKSSDATFTLSPQSNMGILSELELRKRFAIGKHILNASYMYWFYPKMQDKKYDEANISSIAEFQLTPQWILGWNSNLQANINYFDKNLEILNKTKQDNEIYINGIGRKNNIGISLSHNDEKSPYIHKYYILPSIDYKYLEPKSLVGGELSLTGNITALSKKDKYIIDKKTSPTSYSYLNNRLTLETEWKQKLIGPLGTMFIPLISLRGDIHYLSLDKNMTRNNELIARGMFTTGLEARYPVVAITDKSRHIFEGITQLYLSNDEINMQDIPNEDSKSLVLNSASIFSRNKFSGFDRIEGGTRTNIGIRYVGNLKNNSLIINALIGQSIHLAGKNSFAFKDDIGVAINSGLEDNKSDYVGAISLSTPSNLMLSTQALINREDFTLRRSDVNINYISDALEWNINHSYMPKNSNLTINDPISIIKSEMKLKINDNFSTKASLGWNTKDSGKIIGHSIGLSYHNDCTTFNIVYENNSKTMQDYRIRADLSLRTIGGINNI
ncbi:LPS-assembly protein LptD [Candidatus Liberibacter americanus]|uniref:LPS-assembly protein LptD n=1 Tax=Candidatus Liberibacter americanus str. Sao Paulo TaxID=1261131 RepID=U6B405_9HYPH|nr:LPS assembly protein LptD [Candidatus Liberibacter americanus]AHA27670.1 Organic solvent tolerance protein OstA [Candidatus Liberibacter americanus str. Sao Paulo]EMS36379.1 organic solvent tolerance protein [Candidatus Liberibacter americanus PW_SP]